jgi:hypothetical protein
VISDFQAGIVQFEVLSTVSYKMESLNVTPATLEKIVTQKLVKMTALVMDNVKMELVIAKMDGLEHHAVTWPVRMNVVDTVFVKMELVIAMKDFSDLIVLKDTSKTVKCWQMAQLFVIKAGQDLFANQENV